MRQRRYLSFDMHNTRHREALAIFDALPLRQRSETVIDGLLRSDWEQRCGEMIRTAITEVLQANASQVPIPTVETGMVQRNDISLLATTSLDELPGDLLAILDE